VTLVRPLLSLWREDVLDYLNDLGQSFRVDSTNLEGRQTRNRLRNELLPKLRREYNAEVDEAILRLTEQANDATEAMAGMICRLADESLTIDRKRETVSIRISALAEQPSIVVREVCREAWRRAGWPQQNMTFEAWKLLADMFTNRTHAAQSLPGGILARRIGRELVISAHLQL
jgi:tRNA(Ile)-lysidine synthase